MSNVFQTCLKGFKLKMLVIKSKTAQPIESVEESIDPQLNWSRSKSTPNSISQGVGRPLAQSIDPHLNQSRSSQGVVEVQRSPVKY